MTTLTELLKKYDDIHTERAGLKQTLEELSKVDTPESETLRAQIGIKIDALGDRCAQTMLEEFNVRSTLPNYGFGFTAKESA